MSRKLRRHHADPLGAHLHDENGDVLLASGTTVPSDAAKGFATGCLFMQTDGSEDTALYVNDGSNTSCDFNPIPTAVTASSSELNTVDGLTATTAELNNVADASARASTLTAAGLVLTAADTGKIYFIDNATGFVAATLPAPAAGLQFTFVNITAPTSGNHTIVTASSGNVIKGQVYTLDVNSATDPDFEATGGDTLSFVANKAIAGDKFELVSDGTNWFAYGFCSVFDALTITTAS